MYNLLVKHGQAAAFGLGLIVTLLFLFGVFGGMEEYSMMAKEDQMNTGIFNFGLYAAIFLCVVVAAVILLFGVYQTVSNPKGATKFLGGFAVIIVLYMIFSSMAPTLGESGLTELAQKFDLSEGAHKFISASLSTMMVVAGLCLLAFVVSEVRNLFK